MFHYQALLEKMHASGFRPTWIDGDELTPAPGVTMSFFNVIFRPSTGVDYVTRHGMNRNEYQAEFDLRVKQGYRLSHIESYYSASRGCVCYAAIFLRSPGPGAVAYHDRSQQDHQAMHDDFRKKGFVPVNVSVVVVGGQRRYTAPYEARDAGGCELDSRLSVAEYQQKFTGNLKKGMHLGYLNSYLIDRQINIVAIWYSKLPSPFAQHHLDSNEFNAVLKQQRQANLALRAVTGYQRGAAPNFAALWNR
ncbi:hypothetical protein [Sorangium sp. So ce131]|uniref:hypothetical protein n=1 Tax=Sorangium sp. So ce131 TaxID=3133282 RepID=UPI003F63528B